MSSKSPGWVYGPSLDLIVGCGAWSIPLLLLTSALGRLNGSATAVAFYALALIANYPHYMATIYRAYHTREDFNKYRVFTVHLTGLLLLTAVVAHWSHSLLPWIFTIYITWSPWHYSGQNFGLAMMFARRAGVEPKRTERNGLYAAHVTSYLLLFFTLHSIPSSDPYIVSLGFPQGLYRTAAVLLLTVFLASSIWSLAKLTKRAGLRAMVAPIILFSTQSVWFVVPSVLQITGWAQIPQTRYSTGILAVMHSAQYLWITSYYARREASARRISWRPWAYFLTLIVGGIALFEPGPWLISIIFRYDFAASFLVFTALVNIHHFLLDGAVWKLRDGRIADLLVRKESVSAGAALGVAATRWLISGATSARAVRVAATALLLLLAGLDQTRFLFAANESNLTNLARAEALNPYDADIHTRIGKAVAKSGDAERARESFQRAVSINPYNSEAYSALVRVLIESRRYDEAYHHYKDLISRFPRDVDALVNLGTLASQSDNQDEAIGYWQRALAIEPSQKQAHLYLAEALDHQNQLLPAIQHYEQFLVLGYQQRDQERLSLKQVVFVTVKLAQNYASAGLPDRALVYCERALSLAENAGDKSLQNLLLDSMANIFEAKGVLSRAAQSYQRSIKLGVSGVDNETNGMDWFNYGQFLRRHDSPKQLVLACYLKAEKFLESSTALETVRKARSEIEQANEAAAIRENLEAIAREALEVRF